MHRVRNTEEQISALSMGAGTIEETMRNRGDILYKYVPLNRVDILKNRQIRFTSHVDLNDPFECQFAIEPIEREREAALKDGHLAEWAEAQVWLDGLKRLGILSLAESPDNLLMWAHYCQDHTGFVIGFDARHPWFDEGRAYYIEPYVGKQHLGLDGLQPIEYADDLPNAGRNIPIGAFVTKSKEWSYEQEVRKFRHLNEASHVTGSVHLFKFPKDLLREVILGCKAAPELRNQIRCLKQGSLPNLVLKEARRDRRSYSLRIVELDES